MSRNKAWIIAAIALVILLVPVYSRATEFLELRVFPAKLYINFEEKKLPDGQYLLNYQGDTYAPLRFIAEELNYSIGYEEKYNSILITNYTVGPKVRMDQAKLAAYEKFNAKEIIRTEIKNLTDEEKLNLPAEAKDKTPLYYIIHIIANSGKMMDVYISTNNLTHYFTIESNEALQ